MHAAGDFINAMLAIAGWAIAFTAFGVAMIYGALKITDAGKVAATRANSSAGGSLTARAAALGTQTHSHNQSRLESHSMQRAK